jgi:hypothetical protein
MTAVSRDGIDPLDRARRALAAGVWQEAREAFAGVLRE